MNIIFVKEGTLYNALHVNALYNSLLEYYPKARYICYTEDPEGVETEVIPLFKKPKLKKWWNKLALFSRDFPVEGKCMFFDLDTKIERDPRPFLYGFNKLYVVSAYWKKEMNMIRHSYDTLINSSVLTWTHPQQHHIWDHFLSNKDYYMRKYRGIDGFIYNEGFDIGKHKHGILSRTETPIPEAAIMSWNNVDFNEINGLQVNKTVV